MIKCSGMLVNFWSGLRSAARLGALLALLVLSGGVRVNPAIGAAAANPNGEEFIGPLAGWLDARRDFGAVGDGKVDDTPALQRALDALRSPDAPHRVLYIPDGIYRITGTLHVIRTIHAESMDIMILGEDPARTRLRWDGPVGGVMLDYGSWYARMGRLTLDGAGKVGIALAHGPSFVTYNELSDMVFRDAAIGIEAGHMNTAGIAETAVLRCRFDHCTKAGVSIENFNSLDWFLRSCRFDHCALGVTNTFGAGNFHVYQSLFQNSTVADISIGNTGYFSFRNNTSIGSRAFFLASNIGAGAGITIQGNRIYDPLQTPIVIGNLGPVFLLDNIIRCSMSPAVRVNPTAGFLSMGNTFVGSAQPIQAKPSAPRVDDRLVSATAAAVPFPVLAGAPQHRARHVLELPAGASEAAIQQAIDAASRERGHRPVIHLPAGIYLIARPLTIPAGSDLQVAGDGGKTALRWSGGALAGGAVLLVRGPSRAVFRDLTIDGGGKVNGIVVDRCDQPGARIFMEEANIRGGSEVGVQVGGLRHARVDLQDINHSGCGIGVQVLGAGTDAAGAPRVAIWSGASSGNQLSYDVRDGGALLVRDIWYEGAPPGFLWCTGSGSFTLQGAEIAAGDPNHGGNGAGRPTIAVDGFRGRLAFLATTFAEPTEQLVVLRGTPETKVLMIGQGNRQDFFVNRAPAAHAALLQSVRYTPGGGATPAPDRGTADDEFLREMLSLTRRAQPNPQRPSPAGSTDLRLYRVSVTNAPVCVRISP